MLWAPYFDYHCIPCLIYDHYSVPMYHAQHQYSIIQWPCMKEESGMYLVKHLGSFKGIFPHDMNNIGIIINEKQIKYTYLEKIQELGRLEMGNVSS